MRGFCAPHRFALFSGNEGQLGGVNASVPCAPQTTLQNPDPDKIHKKSEIHPVFVTKTVTIFEIRCFDT
jgi:hypothetical protein